MADRDELQTAALVTIQRIGDTIQDFLHDYADDAVDFLTGGERGRGTVQPEPEKQS